LAQSVPSAFYLKIRIGCHASAGGSGSLAEAILIDPFLIFNAATIVAIKFDIFGILFY
jgi:hypothetical protein